MTSYATSTARADMGELRRLRSLLPPELQSWVTVESAIDVSPPLITCEELGKDQVEIQIDLIKWEQLALDQRNLMFWHEVGRIQNDTIPRDGWEMAALAIGLGGLLLTYQALHKLAPSLQYLAGAAIAWQQVKDLFQAAARPQPTHLPSCRLCTKSHRHCLLPEYNDPCRHLLTRPED